MKENIILVNNDGEEIEIVMNHKGNIPILDRSQIDGFGDINIPSKVVLDIEYNSSFSSRINDNFGIDTRIKYSLKSKDSTNDRFTLISEFSSILTGKRATIYLDNNTNNLLLIPLLDKVYGGLSVPVYTIGSTTSDKIIGGEINSLPNLIVEGLKNTKTHVFTSRGIPRTAKFNSSGIMFGDGTNYSESSNTNHYEFLSFGGTETLFVRPPNSLLYVEMFDNIINLRLQSGHIDDALIFIPFW